MRKHFLIPFLLMAAQLGAQVLFTAEASRYKVAVGETFTVTFKINAKANNFNYPDFSGFKVVSGPMTGFQTTIINGKVNQEQSAAFELLPLKTGTFTIGPATVKVDGETYKTKPLNIDVVGERTEQPNSIDAKAAGLASVKILTNKRSVYVGEPISARYTLLLKTNVGNYDMLEEPSYQGFLKNDLELKRIETRQETIDGERQTTADIFRFVLVPQQSGEFNPGKLSLRLPTQVPTGRRDWFGREEVRTVNQVTSSSFPTITVKPLPEAGKPANFSGAVGQYKLLVTLSRDNVKADESITLTVEISGNGNIQLADLPEPQIPTSIERYDPKYKENISTKITGISGNKRNEYLLIPRYRGVYKIPAITFSYFDPEKEEYITLTSDDLEVNVTDGPQATNQPGTTQPGQPDKSTVTALGEDILFIHTKSGGFKKPGKPFFNSLGHALAGGSILLAFLVLFGIARFRSSFRPDVRKTASRKAAGKAERVLKSAKIYVDKGDIKQFYAALTEALQAYFKDKFRLEQSAFSAEAATTTIQQKGGSDDLIMDVAHLLKQADMARFAPLTQANMQADYSKALDCINKMEKL